MVPTHTLQISAALVAAVILVLIVRHRRGEQEYPEVEYILMAAFVVATAVAIVPQVATGISYTFDKISGSMMETSR